MRNAGRDKWNQALGPSPECLPLDELVKASEHNTGATEETAAQRHLTSCAHCQVELALFRSFANPSLNPREAKAVGWIVASVPKPGASESAPWWRRWFTMGMLVPATVGLAAVLVAAFWLPIGHPRSGIDVGGEVMRSRPSVQVEPPDALTPTELRWRSVPDAAIYRVRILEVDRTQLWTTTTRGTSVAIPAAIRAKLTPRKTVLWEVDATKAAGGVIASSGPQRLEVRARKNP